MKTFREFLEAKFIGDNPNSMRVVGSQAATDIAADTLAGFAGPLGGIAKSIFSAAWKQRKSIVKKLKDDATLSKAKQIIATRITQKAQNRPGNVDAIIESYVSATDESEMHLNDQERQLVINAINEAVNNNTIKSGFAQELVNNILQQKISNIQSAISSSQPKRLVV